jgi:hypothetical protein
MHLLRLTGLTTAWEGGSDIIDLQDFAGHADLGPTLIDIGSRTRFSKSRRLSQGLTWFLVQVRRSRGRRILGLLGRGSQSTAF